MSNLNVNLFFNAKAHNAISQTQILNQSIVDLSQSVSDFRSNFSTGLANLANLTNGISNSVQMLKEALTWFEGAMQFEKISIRMAPMLGGLEKTRELLKEIRMLSANGTASFDDLAKTAQILSASFKSHNNIRKWVEAFHNMSAVTGKSTTELSAKFMEVRATGAGMMEMLKQYVQNGVNIFSVIAKERGITENAVAEGIKNRTIGLEEVERAILSVATGTGELAKQATALSNTFSGTIDTIVAKLKIDIAEKIDPALKPLADGFNLIYENLKHIALGIAAVAAQMIKWRSVFATIKAMFLSLGEYTKLIFDAIKFQANQSGVVMSGAFGKAAMATRYAFATIAVSARLCFIAIKAALVSTGIGAIVWGIGELIAYVYQKFMELTSVGEAAAEAEKRHAERLEEVADAFSECSSAAAVEAEKTRRLKELKKELIAIERQEAESGKNLADERFNNAEMVKEVEQKAAAQLHFIRQKEIATERAAATERANAAAQKIRAAEMELEKNNKIGILRKQQIIDELNLIKDLDFDLQWYQKRNQLTDEEARHVERLIAAKKEIHAIDKAIAENREKHAADVEMMRAEIESEEALLKLKEQRFEAELRTKLLAAGYTGSALEAEIAGYKRLREQLAQVRKERSAEKTLREEMTKLAIAEAKANGNTELAQQLQAEYDLRKKVVELEKAGIDSLTAKNVAERFAAAQEVREMSPKSAHTVFDGKGTRPIGSPPIGGLRSSIAAGIDSIQERTLGAITAGNAILRLIEANTRNTKTGVITLG